MLYLLSLSNFCRIAILVVPCFYFHYTSYHQRLYAVKKQIPSQYLYNWYCIMIWQVLFVRQCSKTVRNLSFPHAPSSFLSNSYNLLFRAFCFSHFYSLIFAPSKERFCMTRSFLTQETQATTRTTTTATSERKIKTTLRCNELSCVGVHRKSLKTFLIK